MMIDAFYICQISMPLQQFLSELFEASPNYSLPAALGKLRAFGGISSMDVFR